MRTENTKQSNDKGRAPSFKALVAANRAAGRLAEPVAQAPKVKMELAGLRLWPTEMEQVKGLAAQDDRSAASMLRHIYLRGLRSYMAEHGAAEAAAQAVAQ